MKKTLTVLILLLAAVSAFALNATVKDVVGKVEVQNAAGGWDAVAPGDSLAPGAVLSTGFKSEAVLQIDETVLTVKALTRLTVEKLYEQEGNKSSSFYLDAGALAADVKAADNKKVSFTVKTPAVTASVRGTAGDLTVNTVKGTAGTWLLTPPEQMVIVQDRGDVGGSSAAATSEELPVEFDWSTDQGVTVQPGQSASCNVGEEIKTPMETAAAAATSTGGTETLSSQEAVASSAAPSAASAAETAIAAANAAAGKEPEAPKQKPASSKGSIKLTLKWPSF